MKNPPLSIGAQGDKVRALHETLIQAGFSIPKNELSQKHFGKGTSNALKRWQDQQRLEPTGEVDARTARKLKAISKTEKAGSKEKKPLIDTTQDQDAPIHQTRDVEDESTDSSTKQLRLTRHQKKRLTNLTRNITNKKDRERIEQLYTETEGNFTVLKNRLTEDPYFKEDTLKQLTFSNDLAVLLEDQEELVAAFVNNSSNRSLRDIALNYRKEDIKTSIRKEDIPDDVEGGSDEERMEVFATRINDRLFHLEPTGVIHRMLREKEIIATDESVRKALLSFFDNQPELDFRKTSVLKILQDPDSLKPVPEEQREAVVDRLKKLQRLAAVSSKAEAVPTLMEAGLHSAYVINEVPLENFVRRYANRLGGEDVAHAIHRNAQNITVRNEEAYVALRQAVRGASVNMIHGGASVDTRMAEVSAYAEDKNIPINFETLFGSVDLCECEHCNSVYSPAAYLVELFQYLRNNNLDPEHDETGDAGINNTVVQKLFRRRPDLGRLQLTCENTNTLIPYIDLVNEVMESFVVHLDDYVANTLNPKQARIAVHNVDDESSGELLAEPQHTNYNAYRILKDAVYPVSKLPYHQPIDAIRQYLDYLGTSRYELLNIFRAHVSFPLEEGASEAEIEDATQWEELEVQSIDRAIDAEYLHLVEEEYVILTKEGFHTQAWYELEEETDLTLAEYRERIGLKNSWAYYGISDEDQMLNELKWVKPPQETGIVGFLRRTNILYVDLIELLKTRYINPNYLSGKALAYMNSIRYSYRYLQTLVDNSQADITLKYKQLVQFLHLDLFNNLPSPFTAAYIACWVHRYFEKIGKLIVLEDASSCKCVEGNLQLEAIFVNENTLHLLNLRLTAECQILRADSEQVVGHLDILTGRLILDMGMLGIDQILNAFFTGTNGEIGMVSLPDLVLRVEGQLMACTDYHEKCDLSKTQLKHLDGTDLVTGEYDRIHRFIRLWCKLGWKIEEVDQAITGVGDAADNPLPTPPGFLATNSFVALMPSENPGDEDESVSRAIGNTLTTNPGRDDAADAFVANPAGPGDVDDFIPTPIDLEDCQPEPISQVEQEITPYLIEQLAAIKKLLEITGLELPKLLTYWTTIGIYGEKSLYQRLFLQYNLIAIDKIFDEDVFGTYLTKEGETVSDHLPVLMAALKVDANTIETIMNVGSIADEMKLENVSAIYRYTLLIKTLGLRINELPGLLTVTKDMAFPFGKPTQTMEFYNVFFRIQNSDFSLRTLNYLLLDEDDPERPLRPGMADVFRLAIELRDALLQIETDHADIEKDEEATEDLLRSKLSLLYDGETSEKIISLLQGTTVYLDNTRRKFSTQLVEADQQAITAFLLEMQKEEEEEPGGAFQNFLERVQFSGDRGLQITGILNEPDQGRVAALADLITDLDDADNFRIAADKIHAQPERFFDDVLVSIFTDDPEAAKDVLLAEDVVNAEDQESDTSFQKRALLVKAFMPYLREELRKRMVVQTLASDLGLDTNITKTLVMDVIQTKGGDSIYQEIIRLKEQKDAEAEDQRWQGFFVPEKDGKYIFLLEAEGDATLTFDNKVLWSSSEMTDEEGINFYQSQPRFLKAGRAYSFLLEGYDEDDAGNIIGLFMKFDDQAQVEISDKILFPALRTEAFRQAYFRLHKASLVVEGFEMKLEELEFFREFPSQFEGLDFNALTFSQWLRLEAFYRLQKSLSPTELTLVEFLRWTNQTEEGIEGEPSLTDQIHALTGWGKSDISKMILPKHFNLQDPSHFQHEINLLKLQETLHVAKTIGVGMGYLFKWGKPTSGFNKNRNIAGSIREVIRARYTQEEWEEAIKPVHDKLRENQKQALIAYLLAQPVLMEWGVIDADSLFEFFLIDVQMEACMETSRIKQAISSVQLFITRCLLGLEDKHGVSSNELDRERREWMSHYRVWEANRKVFLYPENWIRPELRDVKSPFFQELESELLQNDVSRETVKNALTKYIIQVDEVANLEVVGQYVEGNKNSGKLHVIGRTRNAPYFFYYRYYEYDTKYWYPWEKVEVDIQGIDVENREGKIIKNGSYVIPAVWKDRLFIFFPHFVQKHWTSDKAKEQSASQNADSKINSNVPNIYWEIKMGWSEYKEGKWTPKSLSNDAIYSLENIELDYVNDEIEGKVYPFLFDDPSKFIFSVLENNSRVIINVFYAARQLRFVNEFITNGIYNLERLNQSGDNNAHAIKQSFRFNGSHIIVQDRPNSAIPERRNYSFHYVNESGDNTIYPLQSNSNAVEPDDISIPFFNKENNFSTVAVNAGDSYRFSHLISKELLGYLRKDSIHKIFNSTIPLLPLSDDNYGSNNGIHYHELKRPYALYNWEALFHSVSMLADHLSKSQRFEESMQWWHYIFDPINVKGNIKNVWKFLPFRVTDSHSILDKIFNDLEPNAPHPEINEWRENPFMPHVIASARPSAYMKWVVMKYIDNIVAWGDYLFRQDTIESINQATQLYILAGHILGPRPEIIPKRGKIQPKSYLSLVNQWDAFSNAIVDLELIFPFSNQINTVVPGVEDGAPHYVNIYGFATTLYFCIPDNPKLLEYWDTVADRLFKIRHCLNIEGIFRKLNLFEPPIDPALLVQAAAQGLNISSVLNDLSTPMPNYRFNYLLQRALEVTSEVKSLGNALLSALEKKDGETLSLLRARHDTQIQNLMMEVRKLQLEEAEKTLENLEQNRKAPEYRLRHYLQLAGEEVTVPSADTEFTEVENQMPEVKEESGMKLIATEAEEMKKAKLSADLQIAVGAVETLASIFHAIPIASIDAKPIGIGLGVSWGGPHIGNAVQAIAKGLQIEVNHTSFQSSAASRKAGYTRQLQDRIFQANLAGHELMQIDKQITAQKIRKEIAQKEIDNHQIQLDQSQEVEEFIRTKFSNQQLYQWMSDQLKSLYYQTYSFAYDLAKKAEKVFRFEMGLTTSDFIKFGYWDSSREGFLAGEQLYLALKHLENAYVEAKPHDYEITKHISLQQLNPLALIQLKEDGLCEFDLPEEIFDLDYAGHYRRRIKTVSVSIPCVAGPYTSLNCTLRLLNHEYRNSKLAASASDYAKKLEVADERFVYNPIPTTAIAVSQGQNDSGIFELNFKDERYLPFEGAGAASRWRLELPQEFRQFDYQTISDVIIHLRYTSCEGGVTLKNAALEHLTGYVEDAAALSKQQGLFRMLSLKHEFPDEWHRLLHPLVGSENPIFILGRLRDRLPFFANSQQVTDLSVHSVMLFAPVEGLNVSILRSGQIESLDVENAAFITEIGSGTAIGQLQQYVVSDLNEDLNGFWGLQFDQDQLTPDTLKNAWLVVKYQLEVA